MEYVDIFLCPELIAPCVCVAVSRAGGWWGPPPGLLGSSAADIFIFWPGAAAAPPQLVRRQSIDRTLDTSRHTPSQLGRVTTSASVGASSENMK